MHKTMPRSKERLKEFMLCIPMSAKTFPLRCLVPPPISVILIVNVICS